MAKMSIPASSELYNIQDLDYYLVQNTLDPYNGQRIKKMDYVLHRTLSEIFRERGSMGSYHIKELIRGPYSWHNHQICIFKLILQREPNLGQLLIKRNYLSLLWIAVLCHFQDTAELLVRFGADVNELFTLDYFSKNSVTLTKKSSILHALFQMHPSSWNERFIGLVICHDADLKVRDHLQRTVLHMAVEHGRVQLVEMLLIKGADVNATDLAGISPLLEAARSEKVEKLIPLLIKHGANIFIKDRVGQNVLHYLASAPGEYTELARVLIKAGVSLDDRYIVKMYQPIHVAVIFKKFELVKLFLDHGANVNAQGLKGESLLICAARYCENPAMMLALLKNGADIDMQMSYGFTVLYELAVMQYVHSYVVEKLKILLFVGGDMFAEARDDGVVPFDVMSYKSIDNPSIRLTLKTLALKKASMQQPPIESKDEKNVKQYPMLWNYYQQCIGEIDKIKATKFVKSGTFFELLTKCQCQVLSLMRYREFESTFRMLDLGAFPLYAEDILQAFKRAQYYYRSVLEKENLIDKAVYNTLPHMVVRNVAEKAVDCNICEIKKTVRASRGKSQ